MTLVISGFPGVGKSHLAKTSKLPTVADSDSSKFSFTPWGARNPDFPNNYMAHLHALMGKVGVVLVSSHQVVRDALVAEGVRFTLVYPKRSSQKEYMVRYTERGSDAAFVALLHQHWDVWLDELEAQPHCTHVELAPGQYLSDVVLDTQGGVDLDKLAAAGRHGALLE